MWKRRPKASSKERSLGCIEELQKLTPGTINQLDDFLPPNLLGLEKDGWLFHHVHPCLNLGLFWGYKTIIESEVVTPPV